MLEEWFINITVIAETLPHSRFLSKFLLCADYGVRKIIVIEILSITYDRKTLWCNISERFFKLKKRNIFSLRYHLRFKPGKKKFVPRRTWYTFFTLKTRIICGVKIKWCIIKHASWHRPIFLSLEHNLPKTTAA